MTSSIWEDFCRGLEGAGDATASLVPQSRAFDLADGFSQLALLLDAALRWTLRGSDPDFPRLVEINDTPEVADNLFSAVRGDATYRLTGDVSTLFDFNISVHTNWGWLGPAAVSGDLGRADMDIDEHGRFELILGGDRRPGNWLPLPPDAKYIQIREYHADFSPNRPGVFDIARLGSEGRAPPRMTPVDLSAKLSQAVSWARHYVDFHQRMQSRVFPSEPNRMLAPTRRKGGNSHIWYGFGRFLLGDEAALLIEFDTPDARLWSIQWLLDPWYENADLANRVTGLPGREAFTNADGRVRIILCGTDPGVRNWLDTSGYDRGFFVTRWIWCHDGPNVQLTHGRLSDLTRRLPSDTPVMTPADRRDQLARRRTHFACRRR